MVNGVNNYSNMYAAGGYVSPYQRAASSAKSGGATLNPGESTNVSPGRKSSPAECETCRNRKYQDGSDEMVSFKSAAHISPQASASRVMAHEQEHVSNAYKKAAQNNGKVISANVSLERGSPSPVGQGKGKLIRSRWRSRATLPLPNCRRLSSRR